MPSLRHSSAMLSAPRRPSRTIQTVASVETSCGLAARRRLPAAGRAWFFGWRYSHSLAHARPGPQRLARVNFVDDAGREHRGGGATLFI